MKSILILLIIGQIVLISANEINFIVADIANVRSKPIAGASITAKLHINTKIIVERAKEDWLKIKEIISDSGKKLPIIGWIHTSLVQKQPVTLNQIEKELEIDTDYVHLQCWADRLLALKPDDLNILERYTLIVKDSTKLNWAHQRLQGKEDVYVSFVNYDGTIYLLGKIDSIGQFITLFSQQHNEEFDRYPPGMKYENEEEANSMFAELTAQAQGLRWYALVEDCGDYKLLEGTPFIATLTSNKLIKLGNTDKIHKKLKSRFLFSSPVRKFNNGGGIDSTRILNELLTKTRLDSSRCRFAYEDQGFDKPMALNRLVSDRIGFTEYYRVSCNIIDMGNKDTIISHFVIDKSSKIYWHLSGRGRTFESQWYRVGPEDNGRIFTFLEEVDTICGCTCGVETMGYIAVRGKNLFTVPIPTWGGGD